MEPRRVSTLLLVESPTYRVSTLTNRITNQRSLKQSGSAWEAKARQPIGRSAWLCARQTSDRRLYSCNRG